MRRQQFRALALATRRQLALIYTADPAHPTDHVTQLALKDKAMQQFRKDYQKLKATWGGFTGYDPWVAHA